MKVLLFAAVLLLPATAFADDPPPLIPDQPILADPPATDPALSTSSPASTPAPASKSLLGNYFENFHQDPEKYSIVSVARGLSTHKAMYMLPYTYSSAYDGRNTELMFQISAKQKFFSSNFYFGYTQKSFWQLFNSKESSPFRETNYNPELFYRWTPQLPWLNQWGADAGFEHESNGRSQPDSRSWNRFYVAPFQAKGKYLVYLKFWYRVPEKTKASPNDAEGDDNPDIERYYGHAEFQAQRQFFENHLVHLAIKGNVNTGKGSVSLNYSIPSKDGSLFYCLNFFSGYGESLSNYNRAITRVGIGVMMAR
jgi:phospholipase A1